MHLHVQRPKQPYNIILKENSAKYSFMNTNLQTWWFPYIFIALFKNVSVYQYKGIWNYITVHFIVLDIDVTSFTYSKNNLSECQ